MDIEATIREILRRTPLPEAPRATHGHWQEPALVVEGLVKAGWGVTPATKEVIRQLNLHPPGKALRGIRSAYYVLMKKADAREEVDP